MSRVPMSRNAKANKEGNISLTAIFRRSQMMHLNTWEYKLVGLSIEDGRTAAISERVLNALGEDGWEAVAIVDGDLLGPHWRVAVMKRERQ